MKNCAMILFLFGVFQTVIYGQDTSIVKYYPMSVGNKWVYNRTQNYYPGPGKDALTIDNSFITGGHKYYHFTNVTYLYNGTYYSTNDYSLRVDSINGDIYLYTVSGGCLEDSLKSRVGDTALSCVAWGPTDWFKCMDTNTFSIFGQNVRSRYFSLINGFEVGMSRRYAKYFGIVYKYEQAVMSSRYYYLYGCVINGILYGDTTIVGINFNSKIVPDKYKLYQNYPNPFNPITQINFDIAKAGDVKLKIYDASGRLITTLLNGYMKPGTYEAEWDGKNYSSGLYFYKLITDEFVQTKKMVLIK